MTSLCKHNFLYAGKFQKNLKNIKKILNVPEMAVITKKGKLAYVITFFISWKIPENSRKILKNIEIIPGIPETAKIAKFG